MFSFQNGLLIFFLPGFVQSSCRAFPPNWIEHFITFIYLIVAMYLLGNYVFQ